MAVQICPRCGIAFDGMGGLSRLDNSSHICRECEQDEAMEDYGGSITPIIEWPVLRPWNEATPGWPPQDS